METSRHPSGWILLLPALGALVLGMLLYQLPSRSTVAVGDLGDRLFLQSSEALDRQAELRGDWYADELGDGVRSRWTRGQALVTFPQIGAGDAEIRIHAQGWPAGAQHGSVRQPEVTARVGAGDGAPEVGRWRVTPEWQSLSFSVPARLRTSPDLVIQLDVSEVFTSTGPLGASDPRPKGIRVDQITVEAMSPAGLGGVGWRAVVGLVAAVLAGTLAARRRTPAVWLAALFGFGLMAAGASALGLARAWTAPLTPGAALIAGAGLALVAADDFKRIAGATMARLRAGHMLTTAAVTTTVVAALLLAAGAVWSAIVPEDFVSWWEDSDLLIQMLPALVVAGVLLASGPTVLPNALAGLRRRLLAGRLTPILLALAAGTILGWELQLLTDLPFVGHADYADNAVVARSLLRGQGWTVPYVTQFYRLMPGGSVYHPQETWPLLQPLWMAPWMALFGNTPFGARFPNILCNVALLLLIYHIGATLWDRRVGLLAAVLTLLNYFFFLLTIYSATDLLFTLLAVAALWLFFRAHELASTGAEIGVERSRPFFQHPQARWAAAGLVTGLMCLQKPTGAIFAVGMGLWAMLLWWLERRSGRETALPWRGLLTWGVLAGLVLSPYLLRNLLLFGRPVFSTEAYDAWILGYKGTRGEAWEEIYRIYLGDLPNRSWVLRWGWDRTFAKLLTQVLAVRNYLLPSKESLLADPDFQGWWLGLRLSAWAPVWLSLLGLFMLRPRQRRLLSLVGLAALLYTTFLVTYWHANEERYFVPLIPWLLLIATGALCAVFDRTLRYRGGRWAGLAGGLAVVILWSTLQPNLAKIDSFLDPASTRYWGRVWQTDLAAYDWLKAHTQPNDVIMTRVPWQLSFAADRPSVMIPNAPLTSDDRRTRTIMQVARYYGARYLLVNAMSSPGPLAQQGLKPLNQGTSMLGFTLVYTGKDPYGGTPIYIYRFPAGYAGAAPLRP